ncbi:MAG: universal stress protein [Deltaproteobacteria bacterium]|nr:MAG: universal stress protein [Deltaproteobacteria bacterium]
MARIRRILHATDFSKASARALNEAIKLAKQNRAEILIVHIIEPTPYVAGDELGSAEIYTKLEDMAKRDAEASMSKLLRRLKKSNIKARGLLLMGSPHDQIVKAAKSKKVDMIVIGTHGRTGLSKLFMGSVAGKVIALATCPVVTVRGK